jgi:hypothetical protein
LRRLDAELSESKQTPDLPIYTVEHVLPQNPEVGSLWLKWYPDEDIRKSWLNRLGNLALLSKRRNASARNFEFERKKNLYFKSPSTPFVMTVQILNQSEWTFDVLEARHRENLDVLKKLWRLEVLQAAAA